MRHSARARTSAWALPWPRRGGGRHAATAAARRRTVTPPRGATGPAGGRAAWWRVLAALALVMGFCGTPARAQAPISRMVHTAWRSHDGAPAGIRALAQGKDGVLWIGAQSGLYAFDGKDFAYLPSYGGTDLPAGGIAALLIADDGAVWAGFATGGVGRLDRNTLAFFPTGGSGPAESVIAIRQAGDGTIWCATRSHVLRMQRGVLRPDSLLLPPQIRAFAIDTDGAQWLGTQKGLYRRPRDTAQFEPVAGTFDIVLSITALPGGGVSVSDFDRAASLGRTQRLDGRGGVVGRLPGHAVAYDEIAAQDGSIWMGTQTMGLRATFWVTAAEAAGQSTAAAENTYRRSDGLTSDAVYALLQDRDGNIWTGTKSGLDRFRPPALSVFTADGDASNWFVCGGQRGDVWIASTGGKLYHVTGNATQAFENIELNIDALACGGDGDLWFANPTGFWHVAGNDVMPVARPQGVARFAYLKLKQFADGSLSVIDTPAYGPASVWRRAGGVWTQMALPDECRGIATAFVDASPRIWLLPKDRNILCALDQMGSLRETYRIDAPVGAIAAVATTSLGLIIAGQNGMALYANGAFHLLHLADPAAANAVSGVAQDSRRDIWAISARGILHIASQDIRTALDARAHEIASRLIQEDDAVGHADACNCLTSATASADGKLWFAGLTGVVSLDPLRLPPAPHLPLLSIKSMLADNQPPDAQGEFQPNPFTLRIAYAGINLSAPETVIYRYRLDGVDASWEDVGHRTEAIYTDLRPGHYVFRLIASNGDGAWTPQLAVPFSVTPRFYQTSWFVLTCSAALIAVLWLLQTLYVQNIIALTRAKANARADERVRIARDLHDTLLQGVHGLLLNVHAAAQSLPADHPAAAMLEHALSRAEDVLSEGRDSVSALRASRVTAEGLVDALIGVGQSLNDDGRVNYSVTCTLAANLPAPPPVLDPQLCQQLFYIAREAITNAFRHAQASQIAVVLTYDVQEFSISCADNGIGLAEDQACQLRGNRHWGIPGMQERATAIGGTLKFRGENLAGTTVRLAVPARRAYHQNSWRMIKTWLWLGAA